LKVLKFWRICASHIHGAMDRAVAATPDRSALIESKIVWTYRQSEQAVSETAAALQSLGVRGGDRMMMVCKNCMALAALLMAASQIDAWAIMVNPRLSARELDQICDHSGARRMLFCRERGQESGGPCRTLWCNHSAGRAARRRRHQRI
jgi:acyl-CoA synthetase (AMP-forming)/AMP-acid ligase II